MMLKRALTLTLTLMAPAMASLSQAASGDTAIRIELARPTFVIPRFTDRFRDREASIAPEEYELADELRRLLDEDNKDKVLEKLNEFYDIELSAAMVALKAQVYMSLEMFDKAEQTYQSVLARKPQLIRAHADLGQLYMLTDRPAEARDHFAQAVAYGSNDARIHGQLGYLNLTYHGPYTAISEYQQALALEPENIQWQQGLLAALTQAKLYTSAEALIGEMLAKKPGNAELWLNKAAIAMDRGDTLGALSGLEMAMLLGDTRAKNLKAATQLHLQRGSFDRAVDLIGRHIDSGSLPIETLNEYLGWLGQARMWDQAARVLDNLERDLDGYSGRERGIYYFHRGRIQRAQNELGAAAESYARALENDPTNGLALMDYAELSVEQKAFTRAELLYSRAEGLEGYEKSAITGKAQLFIEMADYPAALEQLRKAYRRYPELAHLKDNITIVENIIRSNQ